MLLRNDSSTRGNPWRLSLIAIFGLTTGVVLILNYASGAWKWLILSSAAIYFLLWVVSALVTKANGLTGRPYTKWVAPRQRGTDPLQIMALCLLELFYGPLVLLWIFVCWILPTEFQGNYYRPNFFYREMASGFTLVSLWYLAIGLFVVAIAGRFLLRQYSGDTQFSHRRCLETSLIIVGLGSILCILPWNGIPVGVGP